MLSFNGSTGILGTSLSPLGMFAGYLLLHSGNSWIAIAFLFLTGLYLLIAVTTLVRYAINYRRAALERTYLTYPIRRVSIE